MGQASLTNPFPQERLCEFGGRKGASFKLGKVFYRQSDPANVIFFIETGKIKKVVTSPQGKEAVVGLLGPGEFFGEGCLIGKPRRLATAIAMTDGKIVSIERTRMHRALRDDPGFGDMFMRHLLLRNSRVEADLVDHLFNSSEKRLARALLLLANYDHEGGPQAITTQVNQETLAEMVGTTRSRVSQFMNKFRALGFIDYDGHLRGRGHLHVHSSLTSVL
jgi:CRP/FNR family cyclic AMP-dependent transcriptional regulator